MQDTKCQADHLHILGAGCGGNVSGLGPHVKDDGALQPGNQKVRALVDDILLDTRHSVEDDGARAALDVKQRLRGGKGEDGRRHRQPVHGVEGSRGHLVSNCPVSVRNMPSMERSRWSSVVTMTGGMRMGIKDDAG